VLVPTSVGWLGVAGVRVDRHHGRLVAAGVQIVIKSRKQQDIGNLLDLSAPAPGESTPLLPIEPRRPPHEAGCWCSICWQAGLEYADYLQKKRLQEI
jgi:hypothetical protein